MSENNGNARIFFQSLRQLPQETKNFSIQEINHRIMSSKDDVFTIYELILQLRSFERSNSQSLWMYFRRVMSLIALISGEYKIYYTKINILKSFWEDAGFMGMLELQNSATKEIQNKTGYQNCQFFLWKIYRDEYSYYLMRCFNVFVKEILSDFANPNESYSSKRFLKDKELYSIWVRCDKKLKAIVNYHQLEVHLKIRFNLEYCKFILLFPHLSNDKHQIRKVYQGFLQSIRKCIRIMKKFYSSKMEKFIPILKKFFQEGKTSFQKYIDSEKALGLEKFNLCLFKKENGSQRNHKGETPFQFLFSFINRIMKNWRQLDQNNKRKLLECIMQFSEEKVELTRKIPQMKKASQVSDQMFFSTIRKKKCSLRSKKSKSVKIHQKNNYINVHEIQWDIKQIGNQEFSKKNYFKQRSNSQNTFPKILHSKYLRKSTFEEKKSPLQESLLGSFKKISIQDYRNQKFSVEPNKKKQIKGFLEEKKEKLTLSIKKFSRESKTVSILSSTNK